MASEPAAALAAFARYDRDSSGYITIDELKAVVKDLGLLKGMAPHEAAAWVVSQFALADKKTKDGKLDLQEFSRYYAKVVAPRLLEALSAEMPGEVAALRRVFASFACFGAPRGAQTSELDGARFIKLCKETRLVVAGQLSTTDADLIFASVKDRAARRISFEQFLDALDLVATKKGQPLAEVVAQVAGCAGPEAHGATQGEWVKLHDDRSTYTGMYARRSSQGSEGSRPSRGNSMASSSHCRSGAGRAPSSATASTAASRSRQERLGHAREETPDVESRDSLKEAFLEFAAFGTGSSPVAGPKGQLEMDSKQFIKLCRDSGILDGRQLTATAADLAFIAKAKPLGARKIGFRQFLQAVEQMAHEKGVPKEELFAQIASCGGPSLNRPGSAPPAQPAASEARPSLPAAPTAEIFEAAAQELGAQADGSSDGVAVEDSAATNGISEAVGKLSIGGKVVNITAFSS